MKNVKTFIGATLVSLVVTFSQASACSFFISDIVEKNNIIASTASHFQIEVAEAYEIEISDYEWFVSIPTPMCPEEITHQASVKFHYYSAEEQRNCVVEVDVVKKDNWENQTKTYDYVGEPVCSL